MIIEIVVLLGFLGSLIGFIFFIKHYFKSWKAKSDNKKMLMAIECAEDESARYDKFYENILDKIDGRAIMVFVFVSLIAIMLFFVFAPSNKDVSTGNEAQAPIVTPAPASLNDSSNMSIAGFIPDFLKDSKGNISFWFFIAIGGIMTWIMLRTIRRTSCW